MVYGIICNTAMKYYKFLKSDGYKKNGIELIRKNTKCEGVKIYIIVLNRKFLSNTSYYIVLNNF